MRTECQKKKNSSHLCHHYLAYRFRVIVAHARGDTHAARQIYPQLTPRDSHWFPRMSTYAQSDPSETVAYRNSILLKHGRRGLRTSQLVRTMPAGPWPNATCVVENVRKRIRTGYGCSLLLGSRPYRTVSVRTQQSGTKSADLEFSSSRRVYNL